MSRAVIAVGLVLGLTLTVGAAELQLGPGFRIGEAHRMPRDLTEAWHARRQSYPAFNAHEWQLRLQGSPRLESRVYEPLNSADFVLQFPTARDVRLHWSRGSHSDTSDFEPRVEALRKATPFVVGSFGGRSSDGALPYFNLSAPGGGLILAIGWTGDWQATFEALGEGRIQVTAGLPRARLRLFPGEALRLPSVLILGYRGDWLDGQNQFRRLMLHHFTPTNHPPMELMPVAASVHGLIGFNDTSASNLTSLAHDLAASRLPIDTFWLDAGWNVGGFPLGQGNPLPDGSRFPQGLAPVGEAARRAGLRFLAWFEPERAMPKTWLVSEHPDWLLFPSHTPTELRYQEKDGFRLLDLGNPNARAWATDTISAQIREARISVYRQDCNLYPAHFWQTDEASDRMSVREIKHVSGLYDFLDELARRHPDLILDNCASGGRRLDFEMMRRCVALWRSDSCWDGKSYPRNVQAMTHGLSLWLPLHGLGAAATDTVALRSGMGACASFAVNFRDAASVTALRQHLERYLKVRHLFAGDYYPLTPWSDDPAQCLAFQFHDPATGEGLVQVFWGKAAAQRNVRLCLRGMATQRRYILSDWDAADAQRERSGAELMRAGFALEARPGQEAAVLEYRPSSAPHQR